MSPLQKLRGHDPQLTYPFGAVVFAKVSRSSKEEIDSKYARGVCLGPVLGSTGHQVRIRLDSGETKLIVAPGLKLLYPLRYDASLLDGARPLEGFVPPLDEERFRELHLPYVPGGGPSKEWIREHGGTPKCPGCSEEATSSRHSIKCVRRYQRWLRDAVDNALEELGRDPPPAQGPPAKRVRFGDSEVREFPAPSAPSEQEVEVPQIGPEANDHLSDYEPSLPSEDEGEDDLMGVAEAPKDDRPAIRLLEEMWACGCVRYVPTPLTACDVYDLQAFCSLLVDGRSSCDKLPPRSSYDDVDGIQLDNKESWEGMKTEVKAVDSLQVGLLRSKSEVDRYQEENPGYDEIQPGRLLHVRLATEPCTNLLAVYQHSWRSDLSTASKELLLSKRATVWRRIQQFVHGTSARSQLVLAGDFNCPITECLPFVGKGYRRNVRAGHRELPPMAADSDEFLDILKNEDLQVLNSFGKSGLACSTYINASQKLVQGSQIDFIIMRRSQADDGSRCAQLLRDFPLLPIEGMWHYPLRARLPCPRLPRHQMRGQRLTPDSASLALNQQPVKAQQFQQLVAQALDQCVDMEGINTALTQSWSQVFGPVRRQRTVHAKDCCLANMWHHRTRATQARSWMARWHHISRYQAIRRTIQQRVRAAKQARLQQQLLDAESASTRGNPGALYQIIRRIAPKLRRRKLQLRDEHGRLLGPRKEAEHILAHYSEVFASASATEDSWLTQPLHFEEIEFQAALSELPLHKALPAHCAPAPLWRWCADTVSSCTARLLKCGLQAGSFRQQWPLEWAISFLCLLPKTDQKLDAVTKLRPISLLHPLGKSFAGMLMYRVRDTIAHKLADTPQFAYLVGRSTADAVDRAVWHIHQTRQRVGQQYTIHHRRAGIPQHEIRGSLTLSIDLRRAFDSIDRCLIAKSLEWAGVPTSLVEVIVGIHEAMRVSYASCSGEALSTATGRGLRQGCRLAPIIWACITGYLMSKLGPLLDQGELRPLLTLFADDTLGQWEIQCKEHLSMALTQVAFLLDFLKAHNLCANTEKSVILIKLAGAKHVSLWNKHTTHDPELGLCARIPCQGHHVLLPVKSKHKYLGVMLSYNHLERETAAYRTRCAQASFARIQVATKRTSRLSLRCRVRLWRAVVWTTMCYGIDCTGLDIVGRRQLYATAVRHLRAMANSPSHISRETTSDLLLRLELPHPADMLLDKTKARHERTSQSQVFALQPQGLTQVWDAVLSSLEVPGRKSPAPSQPAVAVTPPAELSAVTQEDNCPPEPAAENGPEDPVAVLHATPAEVTTPTETIPPAPIETGAHADLVCPVCDYQAADTTALRYHMTSIHGLSERELAMATAAPFKFEEHSYAGMPTCKHCRKSFSGIPQFRKHIEAQACPVLHGYTNNSRDYGQHPPLPKEASTESTPLRDRPSTLQHLSEGGWLQLAQSPGFREVALAHCPLCHLWVANSSGQVKKHMRTKHGDQQDMIQEVIEVCRKSSYFVQSPCQLCGIAWKGPRIRHREACAVLFAARLLAAHHGYVFRDEHGTRAIASDGVRVGVQPTAAEPVPVLPPPAVDTPDDPSWQLAPTSWHPSYPSYQGYQGYSDMYVTQQEIQLLRQLLVRHEWVLAALRVDRGFVLHMRSGPDGILREVFQASKLWNEAKTQGTLQNLTLRQALLMKVFTVLKDRMEHMNEGHIATARKHGWLSRDGMQWQYLKWSQTHESLIPEDPVRQVPHDSLVQHITSILRALNMDHMIHRFAATRKLTENVENTMPFLLQISLQGQTSHQLFQALQDLCGAGSTGVATHGQKAELVSTAGQCVGGSSPVDFPSPVAPGGRHTQIEVDAAGRAVDIWSVLPWISATRTWRAPRRQHDIAEFLLYMRPQLNASLIDGSWGTAGSAPHRGLEVVDDGHTWPMLLANRPASAADDPTPCSECCLQDLLSCWHQQAEPQALLKPPKFCAIQVGRFDSTNDGACIKTDFKLCLEPLVHIPAFRDNLQDVYFVKYFVRACAVHHGPTPDSGHYRSILMPPNGVLAQSFYTDDNATARKVKSSELVGIQQNAYIIFLQRAD
ncbi:pol [Symbiodinium sp. CCMP2592]|nr:pol [Symbiodinium sp. CCMP2592]